MNFSNQSIIQASAQRDTDQSGIDPSRRRFLFTATAVSSLALFGGLPELASAYSAYPAGLEKKIEQHIKLLRQRGVISSREKTAWSVYDFTTQKKLVSINENAPFQSASMIKPFIALAFFQQLRTGRVRYDRVARAKMEAMIQRSSNSATNYFINLLGGRRGPQQVERILRRNNPGMFQQTRIVERIPTNGRTYRNKASARDYSRFLYALWHDKLPYSREIKRLMRLPNKDRIYNGAEKVPPGTMIYDKTGTTSRLCGDMGIVVARGRNGRPHPYTFIAIIERSSRAKNLGHWSSTRGNVIRQVSSIVYTELKKTHNLV
ncbi:MAG: serine hydrolase [Candidatus Competibacteraceae bacterium]|jgi:beta-lactamase class A|nr:serine hydrolase [Candidatus Competibacteraceae bacterium]